MRPERASIAGLVLAGGLSRRMGGAEKSLVSLAGRPMIEHVIARARPQIARLAINANGDPARFSAFGLPVLPDLVPGAAGPLAGVLTGLDWAAVEAPGYDWLLTVPCDAPFLPADLVARLADVVAGGAEIACARSLGRDHPVAALWPVRLRGALAHAVGAEGLRKVDAWTSRYKLGHAEFAAAAGDPFFNVNSAADLDAAETRLAAAIA